MRILTEPKNALARQFQEFFSLDSVELVFTEDALEAAAEEALRHKTGARGLRTVLEDCLLDVMYEIPSRGDVKKCVVDADAIRGLRRPLLLNPLRPGARDRRRRAEGRDSVSGTYRSAINGQQLAISEPLLTFLRERLADPHIAYRDMPAPIGGGFESAVYGFSL